jgi:hypothetical protein
MDELDNFPDSEDFIVREYRALGYFECTLGGCYSPGYFTGQYQYPPTNWFNDPDRAIRFLQRQVKWANVTFVCAPDAFPYFDGRTFNWDLMRRDFLPFWKRVCNEVPQIKRVQDGWEMNLSMEVYAQLFDLIHEGFESRWDEIDLVHHNPVGHLSPGTSDQNELDCWKSAVVHGVTGMRLQAAPPSDNTHLPPHDQMIYDLKDMYRRFNSLPDSPWGSFPLSRWNKPVQLAYGEGCSVDEIHNGLPHSVAQQWGHDAKAALPDIIGCMDGYKD